MAADNPQAGQGRPLPKKESDLFRNLVKHYEVKQYKKALKQADAILKKFPKHGETLAMKGLILNCLKKREEAHALVKEGLMNDMRSHVCWHVYGLLYRSDRNYNEAIKAYKQALRIDPENLQILRDLSLLQIQMRDLNGYAVTRHTLLTLKPNAKVNWLSFALAKHLTGDLRGAISVIDIYLGTLSGDSPELLRGFESSELAMYRNKILAELANNWEEALEHLVGCEGVVVDRTAWLVAKVRYELQLRRFHDAANTSRMLFERGLTEDYRVHSAYMCALLELDPKSCDEAMSIRGTETLATVSKLEPDQKRKLLDEYRSNLQSKFPRSPTIRRIPLSLLEGVEFRTAMDTYCRMGLAKGVPSLCSDVSSFITVENNGKLVPANDPVDVKPHATYAILVSLADGYISSLSSVSKLSTDEETEEPPSTILWAWYFRACLHELAAEYGEGIALLEKCLEHTPTAVDVYELKARLLKAAGDLPSAVECVDTGREMDKQDRYINNLTTMYMLQAGMDDTALNRMALFTKHEGNPEQNLFDMQCSWYELELADCLAQKKDWGRSLKKYVAVVKHFEDFQEDQFDFHAYCVRKVTLRAYTDVLRFEDNLWGQEFYGRAAEGIIGIYLHLYDHPEQAVTDEEPDYSNMSAAEKKKAKAIARKKKKAAEKKAATKFEQLKEEQKSDEANGGKKKKVQPAVTDEDPDGKELLKKDPLQEAKLFAAILSKHAPGRVSSWILQYDVAIRRGKALMALQALFKAQALEPENNDLFTRTVDFACRKDSVGVKTSVAKEVVSTELPVLLGGKSVADYVRSARDTISCNTSSALSMRVAVAKALILTKVGSVSDAASIIVEGGLDGRGVTVSSCREALEALEGFGDDATQAKQTWVTIVKDRFPMLVDFR